MSATAGKWSFTKGLHELGNGCYAYLQPNGSWGWSNAGLVVDGDQSLLVDTLFDLKLTREMLEVMRRAQPRSAARSGTLVNTHSNGDHCFGNELVEGAEIIASKACAEEMRHDGGRGDLFRGDLRTVRFRRHQRHDADADLRPRTHAPRRRQDRPTHRGR